MTLLFSTLGLLLLLLIIVAVQGKHTKATAIRLPEADGERLHTATGNLSLLHIGESTVAGVGVETLDSGLTSQLIQHLETLQSEPLRWQILGENGARIGDLLEHQASITKPDVLIITFGVNDTTKFTSRNTWIQHLQQCVSRFADRNTRVFVTAVPPMHRFPLLPAPLKWLLGAKATQLDSALKHTAALNGWHYIGNKFKLTSEYMAHDGYHPNREGYQVWGQWIAEHISAQIAGHTAP